MSLVLAVAGTDLLIKVGDGGSPEVFTAPASANAQRDITLSTTEKTTEIPDASDLTLPASVDREITAVDWTATVQGLLNKGDDLTYTQWWLTGASKNVKMIDAQTGGLTLAGPAKLTDLKLSGERGGKVEFNATYKGAGKPTATAT